MSISATTRPQRPGEVDDVDYHFVSEPQFDRLIEADEFVEWAPVFGHRYGTPKAPVKAALKDGRDILFDIDWQGTQQLHSAMGEDLVRIFILPPSLSELERRLRDRGTDPADVVADRMQRAAGEISHWAEYDYVLINREMDQCLAEVRSIVAAERLKRARQIGLVPFVRDLIGPSH
jgi:guanylate kinase